MKFKTKILILVLALGILTVFQVVLANDTGTSTHGHIIPAACGDGSDNDSDDDADEDDSGCHKDNNLNEEYWPQDNDETNTYAPTATAKFIHEPTNLNDDTLVSFVYELGDVHITDSGTTGSVWSGEYGGILLNPVNGNVSISPSGILSGRWWGDGLGWIELNCANPFTSDADGLDNIPGNGDDNQFYPNGICSEDNGNFKVSITSEGKFLGYAWSSFAGYLKFECDGTNVNDSCVRTTYIPQNFRPQCNNGIDDDGDNKIDYSADGGCSSLADDDETNIGGVVFLPPSRPSPRPTVDIKANSNDGPISVQSGSQVTLSWTSTNATTCYLQNPENPENSVNSSGSRFVSPTSTTTYTLTCSSQTGSASDSVTVEMLRIGMPEEIVCGDGDIGPGEGCDDGNIEPGDGCSELCEVEEEIILPGPTLQQCSDSTDNEDPEDELADGADPGCYEMGGEFDSKKYHPEWNRENNWCNNGRDDDGDGLADFKADGSGDPGCEDENDNDETDTFEIPPPEPLCGNDKLDAENEECDDGNNNDDDGCSAFCQIELEERIPVYEGEEELLPLPSPTIITTGGLGGAWDVTTDAASNFANTFVNDLQNGLQNINFSNTGEALGGLLQSIENLISKFLGAPLGRAMAPTVTALALATMAAYTFLTTPVTRLWNLFLGAVGAVKRKPWGTAFDSETMQGIDPVYIQVFRIDTSIDGKRIETESASAISALHGEYMLPPLAPGRYRIGARKPDYFFPSKKLSGKTEAEFYPRLYFGEEFEITEPGQVINFNIPFDPDPAKINWNELAKKERGIVHALWHRIVYAGSTSFFILGLIITLVSLLIVPKPWNIAMLVLYLAVALFRRTGIPRRKQGRIMKGGTILPFAITRFYNVATGVEVRKTVADIFGRYYALLPKGVYSAKVFEKNSDGSYTLIHTSEPFTAREGIVNKKFRI